MAYGFKCFLEDINLESGESVALDCLSDCFSWFLIGKKTPALSQEPLKLGI